MTTTENTKRKLINCECQPPVVRERETVKQFSRGEKNMFGSKKKDSKLLLLAAPGEISRTTGRRRR